MKCKEELDKKTPVMQVEAAGNVPLPVFPAKVGHSLQSSPCQSTHMQPRPNESQLSIWDLYPWRVLCCCQLKAILACILA